MIDCFGCVFSIEDLGKFQSLFYAARFSLVLTSPNSPVRACTLRTHL